MTPDDFTEFFAAVHGHEPFPWQRRLARRVVEGEGWPSTIALPTAAGKTAVIDIAVFALAYAGADHARRAPRRIFFVIDRRIVVDAAHERAVKLACRLEKARTDRGGVLREVAERLVSLGGATPLQVAVLRGGMYRDHAWAGSPAQPLVCVSTVDQVGSRVLYRGYGVSTSMLPIHAALVSNDALIVLDEAHISQPFDETLSALARYRTWADVPIDAPWLSVRMSATPDPGQHGVFREDSDDYCHELLAKRFDASKHAELVRVECEAPAERDPPPRRRELEQTSRGKLVEEAARQARRLRDEDGDARVTAVVVNRVDTARAVFEQLRREPEADAILLTGRSRPWDRNRLLEEFLPRMRAGRVREGDQRHLFVVATQSIEVGADLDFDALVTECASLDAVRQRFGRLDRFGERGTTRAVVVARSDHVASGAMDPIYGDAIAKTWRWLSQTKGRRAAAIDMGVKTLGSLLPGGEQLESMCSPRRHAPVLLPAHLDLWVQTSPVPVPDPDVSIFLHGPKQGPADVQLVWRADLQEDDPSLWSDIVALSPPSSGEAMPVPLYAVREWLKGLPPSDVADVEGALRAEEEQGGQRRRCLRWRGVEDEATGLIQPDEIAPGDTIVVPATYGGADAFGWNPESTDAVQDVGDAVSLEFRRRPVVRLHASAMRFMFPEEDEDRLVALEESIYSLRSAFEDDDLLADRERAILQGLATSERSPEWAREAAVALLDDPRRRRVRYPDDSGVALIASRRLRTLLARDEGEQVTDEDDATLFTRPVALDEHTDGVRQWVERFGQVCVGKSLVNDLALAAELHDFGKVDSRFQAMLHGGDEVAAAMAAEPLAKSGMNHRDRRARRLAREHAGCPAGYRHEATSLALIVSQGSVLQRAHDPDLVLHLVASHHGFARPLLPVVHDPEPVPVRHQCGGIEMVTRSAHGLERLDSGVADRFWQLVHRYGYFGLAYLEAILRLADHRRSEEEEERS